MPSQQFKFDFAPEPLLRISEIVRILRDHQIMRTPPSRHTFIALCEDGTLRAIKTRFGWLVYERSFEDWVRSLQAYAREAA